MEYLTIKTIHMTCAYLSISLFLLRSFWNITNSSIMQQTWVKVVPHIIDSVLFLAAIYMVIIIGPHHPFILVKIILLLVYILFGSIAIKHTKTTLWRVVFTLAAAGVFYYIVGVGRYKSPASWWAV